MSQIYDSHILHFLFLNFKKNNLVDIASWV